MALHIVQVSSSSSMSIHPQFRTLSKILSLSSHPYRLRSLSSNCKMSTETESSSPLTHSITLPTQLAEPVQIVAAPGISDSQFRTAINSSLFKQWLKNLQTETGILANNAMSLKRVLLQSLKPTQARGSPSVCHSPLNSSAARPHRWLGLSSLAPLVGSGHITVEAKMIHNTVTGEAESLNFDMSSAIVFGPTDLNDSNSLSRRLY
ncbi:hypothetical protein CMV_026214 [Castanea mollissima]|uniref:Uncharacterized protein n=1 Tax=Castanea mollissima TaxID=60419 RepID=A0A8J4V7T3_9ROSI|nr:hypothetical protein CMV_026214 [Castanea mollissima]